jgi:hypothetical protein
MLIAGETMLGAVTCAHGSMPVSTFMRTSSPNALQISRGLPIRANAYRPQHILALLVRGVWLPGRKYPVRV